MSLSVPTTGTTKKQTEAIALFNPLEWQLAPLRDKSKIALLTGAAGGGKSRTWAEKIHAFAMKYDGAMGLMIRKTRESMTNSTVLFYERQIVGGDRRVKHYSSKSRFEYSNGSIVAYGGMKDEEQREQIRSIGQDAGLDFVWMEEATRFEESDLNELLARMRGKAAGWVQIALSTNPGAPTHWIKTRLIDGGQASVYYSSAADNPHNAKDYLQTLGMMTGIQALRLREGKWVQAEGVVYPNWDMANVTAEADYDPSRELWWAVDDGYAEGQGVGTASYHPRVILFMQPTAIGGVNVIDEYYATGELSEVSIANALAKPYARPDRAYVDSSAAELKARLWHNDIMTIGATHPVSEGIKNLRNLICDANEQRLFRIHPRCANLNRELSSYRYDDASRLATIGEPKPLKVDDHGTDAARYGTYHMRHS